MNFCPKFIAFCCLYFCLASVQAQFSSMPSGLPGTSDAKLSWSDYDNDLDLDIAIWGDTGSSSSGRLLFYTNNAGTFSLDTAFLINESVGGNIEWGDYDNDNDPDLLYGGSTLRVFVNNAGSFTELYPMGNPYNPMTPVHWGDFNNDGCSDILEANRVNLRSGNAFIQGTYAIYFDVASSAVGDIDADGDLDFMITGDTSSTGYITVTCLYSNNGDGTFTISSTGIMGAGRGEIVFVDIDQDGDLDVSICGSNLNTLYIFKIYTNNSGTFTDINAGLIPVYQSGTSWGDFNNDGFPDLAYCGTDFSGLYESKIIINNGGISFSVEGSGMASTGLGDLEWGDFDNDNDLDLLVAGRIVTGKTATIYVNNYTPNTSPTPPSALSSIVNVNEVQLNWQAASDVQSAGISLTYDFYLRSSIPGALNVSILSDTTTGWKKTASPGNRSQSTIATVKNLPCGFYTWKAQAVDAGYLGSTFSQADTFSIYYPLAPGLIFPADHSIGHPLGFTFSWNAPSGATTYHIQVATDSLFQNLVTDDSLIATNSHTVSGFAYLTNYFWRVRANNVSYIGTWSDAWTFQTKPNADIVEITSALAPMVNEGEVKWIDFDNDNDMDLVMTGDTVAFNSLSRMVVFYTNNQGILTRMPQPAVPQQRFSPKTYWADVDSDGDMDFILMADAPPASAYVRLFINNNGIFALSPQILPVVTGGSIDWGDYDNDGDPDLLLCGRSPASGLGITRILENNNGILNESGISVLQLLSGAAKWLDADSDGDLDILFSGDTLTPPMNRCTKLYLNNNAVFNAATCGLEHFFFSNGHFDCGDIDNDGDVDLVLTGDSLLSNANNAFQTARIYQNSGGAFSLIQILADSILGQVSFGDINNDGKIDIAMNGTLPPPFPQRFQSAIWLNNGSGFTASSSQPAPWKIGFGNIDLADFDNDNDLDIALSGSDSTYSHEVAKLYKNDYAPANTIPSPPTLLSNSITGSHVLLNWNPGTDLQTVSGGISYNVSIGRTNGGTNVIAPNSNLQTGYRKINQVGNAAYLNFLWLENLSLGWYYWQVQSVDASGIGSAFSPVDSFYVNVPVIPTLVAPANDSAEVPLQMTFTWMHADSAQTYQLQVAIDTLFTQLVSNATLTDTFYNWQAPDFYTQYFWRVRAQNNYGISDWSAIWDFKSRSQFDRLAHFNSGYGQSFADYDSDGDLDLFIMACVSCADSIRMMVNNNGNFVSTTLSNLPRQLGSGGSTWGDYDNDGDPDLLMYGSTLNSSPYNPVTKVYQNNNGTLTDINAGLTGVLQADAEWIDYDNDGDLDISLLGRLGFSGQAFRLYKNENNIFVQDSTLVHDYWWSSMDWGDYDNDGDYDLGVSGRYVINSTSYFTTTIYRNDTGHLIPTGLNLLSMDYMATFRWVDLDNDGDLDISLMGRTPTAIDINTIFINNYGVFTQVNPGLALEDYYFSDWADFDLDGDADILLSTAHISVSNAHNAIYKNSGAGTFTILNENLIQYLGTVEWVDYDGDGDADFMTRDSLTNIFIYRNALLSNVFTPSVSPTPPATFSGNVTGNTVSFSWTPGSDPQTPTPALTYNVWIKKINDTVNYATSLADTTTGRRMVLREGNAGYNLSHTFYNLDSGTYVARVQSLDMQYNGSPFSSPFTFTVTSPLAPTLILPADSAHTSVNLSFQWIAFPNTTLYHIQIAYDSLFTSLVLNDSLITSTVRAVNGLPSDTTLFWKVRAWNGNSWSSWAIQRRFYTHGLFTTPFSSPPVCPYDSSALAVGYSTSVPLLTGNMLYAELSDGSGSFVSPLTIGTLATIQASGTLQATIPPGLPAGSNYRIRVTSNSPAMIGPDNGSNIVIYPQTASATIIASDTILCVGNVDTLSFTGSGYSSFVWSTSEITPQITTTISGSYDLILVDANACQLTVSQNILFENCSYVWSGDTDDDLAVTTADLLPIGIHYGLNGYPRDTVSILWNAHEALDWGVIQLTGTNTKHADCDGDGIILANDTNAIVANFGNTHIPRLIAPNYVQSNIPVYLGSLYNSYAPGSLVTVSVNIGSITTPATNVYGGDIQISLPPPSIVPGSANRSYVSSWLGTVNSDLMAISQFGFQQQSFSFALTRFDHTNRNGYAPVAELSFLLDSTLAHGDSIIISIDNAILVDSNGVHYTVFSSGFTLHVDTTLSGIMPVVLSDHNVSVFPNPFSSELLVNINSTERAPLSVMLVDISGRKLGDIQNVSLEYGMNQFKVNVPAEIEAGIYFLRMTCGNSSYLIKVVKI